MGILKNRAFRRILSIVTLLSFISLMFIAAPNVFADKIDGWLEGIEAWIEKVSEKYLKPLRVLVKNLANS